MIEVIRLHDHVVEFQEGQTLFHPLLIALGPQHIVHREAGAHFPQKLHIIQFQQPIGVVEHLGLAFAELDEFLHLALEALGVVIDVFLGEHLPHIGAAGGVADHGSAAADEGDGPVARHLQPLHQGQGHEMTGGQAVGCAVKADVKHRFAFVDHLGDLFFVCHLGHKASGFQFLIHCH